MVEKIPGPGESERELPEPILNIRISYEALRDSMAELNEELGYAGRINQEYRARRNRALFDFIQEHPEDVPEIIPLIRPQRGEPMELEARFLKVRFEPRRSALYFLPRTFERYELNPPGTAPDSEFNPESSNFKGLKGIEEQRGRVMRQPIEQKMSADGESLPKGFPFIFNEKIRLFGATICEVESAVHGKERIITKVLEAITESLKQRGREDLLGELQARFDKTQEELDQEREKATERLLPLIKKRIGNFINAVRDNYKKSLPQKIAIHQRHAEFKDPTDYQFDLESGTLLFVPKNKHKNIFGREIEKPNLAAAREASEEEWISHALNIKLDLLDVLPENIKKPVIYGRLSD